MKHHEQFDLQNVRHIPHQTMYTKKCCMFQVHSILQINIDHDQKTSSLVKLTKKSTTLARVQCGDRIGD